MRAVLIRMIITFGCCVVNNASPVPIKDYSTDEPKDEGKQNIKAESNRPLIFHETDGRKATIGDVDLWIVKGKLARLLAERILFQMFNFW